MANLLTEPMTNDKLIDGKVYEICVTSDTHPPYVWIDALYNEDKDSFILPNNDEIKVEYVINWCLWSAKGSRLKPITPRKFKEEMEKVVIQYSYNKDVLYSRMNDLIFSVFISLGYRDGIEVFSNAKKWYS